MATATVAAKTPVASPASPPPPVAPTGVRAQKLREAQTRKLAPDRIQPEGHFSLPQRGQVPAGWDFEDCLNPDFWAFIGHRMASQAAAASAKAGIEGAEIRLVADDLAWCADVMVTGVRRNALGQVDGLYVQCIGPSFDPAAGKACPVDVKTGMPWKSRKAQ